MLVHRMHRIATLMLFSIVSPMEIATAQPMVIEYRSGLTVEIIKTSQVCIAVATMGTNVLTSSEYRSQSTGITRGCHISTLELFTTNALDASLE